MSARHTTPIAKGQREGTPALRRAEERGLLAGPKSKHLNAKVPPQLFEAAAKRLGTTSPAAVVTAALASLAAEDSVGPWLVANAGAWADLDPEILELIEF